MWEDSLAEEILTEFVDLQYRKKQPYEVTEGYLVVFGGRKETQRMKDLAQQFLDADEEKREEMRKLRPTAPSGLPESFPQVIGELGDKEREQIRKLSRLLSGRELARRYNVSHTTIGRILKSK